MLKMDYEGWGWNMGLLGLDGVKQGYMEMVKRDNKCTLEINDNHG